MPGQLDTLRQTALDLVTKFGKDAVLRRYTSTFNVATGKNVKTSADTAVIITPPDPVNQRWINNGTAKFGDAMCSLAAQGLTVIPDTTTDKLVFDGREWQIVVVSPTYSGQQVALYTLQLRQ